MNALLIRLKLESPLLLSGVGNGDENSGRTLPYLPGAALRGALIARWQGNKDLPADATARRLFFSGAVRYLNAYPDLGGERALPIPASWRKKKGEDDKRGTDIADFALFVDKDKDTRPGKPFCDAGENDEWIVVEPDKELNLHIGAQGRGHVRKSDNTVFQYEALDGGQTFVATVIAEDPANLEDVRRLLKSSLRLSMGRSRSAEYGQVSILNPDDLEIEQNWSEAKSNDLDEWTVVTFLSDALLRDEHGQPTLDFDAVLGRRLGREVRNEKAFILPTLVGGFIRKWGLPLPQSPAVGMGSVFVYKAADLAPANLQILVESGVGERLAEGFGRIAVNWPGVETLKLADPPRPIWRKAPALSPASRQLAQEMANRLLRRKLDDRLLEKSLKLTVEGNITNHTLSRLRTVLRRALTDPQKSLQPVPDFLDDKKLKEPARKQFERVRVGDQRLYHWAQERAAKMDALSPEWLSLDEKRDALAVAGQTAQVTDLLKREYTLKLLEAVVDGKMKRNRQEAKE